jgi:flagellin
MDVLGSADQIRLNLSRVQYDERTQTRALASGLRVASASDDPSGLAISENLQGKVNGLTQSVQNVQTANNLLSVADNTLDTVQRILSRIHTLVVQSRSDINSKTQLDAIQSEIDSLLQEINKVSSEANFNGVKLFDGSLDTSQATQTTIKFVANEPDANGNVPSSQVYDFNNTGGPDPGPMIFNVHVNPNDVQSSLVEIRIMSYSTNPVDPFFGPLGGPGLIFQTTAYSNAGPQFGAAPEEQYQFAVGTGTGPTSGSAANEAAPAGAGVSLINFDVANFSQQDVGKAVTVYVSPMKAAGTGHALDVNDSGDEGGTVSISLPALNTNALNVSGISVLPPDMVDHYTNTVTGESSSNQYAADFAELRVNDAMDQLSNIRAQVGAQSVSLQSDANDASVAIVNETAAVSSIRDTDIAAASISMTKDQILTQFGTSVLAQMQANQKELMSLMVAQTLR